MTHNLVFKHFKLLKCILLAAYKITSQRLTNDGLHVEWTDGSPGDYIVDVFVPSQSQQEEITCDMANKFCMVQLFVLGLTGNSAVVTVKKSSNSNSVVITDSSGMTDNIPLSWFVIEMSLIFSALQLNIFYILYISLGTTEGCS